MNKSAWAFLIMVLILGVGGIYWYQNQQSAKQPPTGIANPASVNCINLGGQLELVDENNGVVGYCHLKDGRVCEEWSLMRGGCMAPGATTASSSVQ